VAELEVKIGKLEHDVIELARQTEAARVCKGDGDFFEGF
jgi:hypothetical protein